MRTRLFSRTISLPGSRLARTMLGGALIVGGLLGFLPVLGFWMIPLGLIVLSVDSPLIRRWRRRMVVWMMRRRMGRPGRRKSGANSEERGTRP